MTDDVGAVSAEVDGQPVPAQFGPMTTAFPAQSLVVLCSGGPVMTVWANTEINYIPHACVAWFDKRAGEVRVRDVPTPALRLATNEEIQRGGGKR